MKLLAKFNLIFIVLFGSGLAVTGWLARQFLRDNAREQVIRQAQLMMATAMSTREYTNAQIKPLLEIHQAQTKTFLPQTVPAFAATASFNHLRKTYPEYTYKEATLNPTNLSDRAVDWEADIVNSFRNHGDRKLIIGERDTPTGRSLYLGQPISAPQPCLECHSTPSAAPRAMIRLYGTANGFGWKPNEIVGAQIVSVPMEVPEKIAATAFRTLLIFVAVTGLVTLAIVDGALVLLVIRPVRRLSQAADRISRGDMDVPELPVSGKDEVSQLTASFNRMYVSLVKALKMLEG